MTEFRLNSAEGKQILAMIRRGDYAHPGEEEAIALSLNGLTASPAQRLLDVGCGRGGTADWMVRQGWRTVVGIDRDAEAIHYARERYPGPSFQCCDVLAIDPQTLGRFDQICLFNAFYAFAEQQAALARLRTVAAEGALIRLFDYAQATRQPLPQALGEEIGQPIRLDVVGEQLSQAGWRLVEVQDLSGHYQRWYAGFLEQLGARREAILRNHGGDWYAFVSQWYGALHQALLEQELRGVLILAEADPGAGQPPA